MKINGNITLWLSLTPLCIFLHFFLYLPNELEKCSKTKASNFRPFMMLILNADIRNSTEHRIFSDVAGDITIVVDGESFLLHKVTLIQFL